MPIIKSAKKRVKVSAKAYARNTRTKRDMRDAIKALAKALEGGKPAEIAKAQTAATSAIDTAAKKNVIHRNKAARFKSRMASQVKTKGVKPTKSASQKSKVASPKSKSKKIAKKSPAKE